MANATESKFWLKGEEELNHSISELIKAYNVYLFEGPAVKTDYINKVIRHVIEATKTLTELEKELFGDD